MSDVQEKDGQFPVPAALQKVVASVERAFGLSRDVSIFLTLEALAFAAGPSFLLRNPDRFPLHLSCGLLLITSGDSLMGGAFHALVKPAVNLREP